MQYNEKWPISLIYESQPLITVVLATPYQLAGNKTSRGMGP